MTAVLCAGIMKRSVNFLHSDMMYYHFQLFVIRVLLIFHVHTLRHSVKGTGFYRSLILKHIL